MGAAAKFEIILRHFTHIHHQFLLLASYKHLVTSSYLELVHTHRKAAFLKHLSSKTSVSCYLSYFQMLCRPTALFDFVASRL